MDKSGIKRKGRVKEETMVVIAFEHLKQMDFIISREATGIYSQTPVLSQRECFLADCPGWLGESTDRRGRGISHYPSICVQRDQDACRPCKCRLLVMNDHLLTRWQEATYQKRCFSGLSHGFSIDSSLPIIPRSGF